MREFSKLQTCLSTCCTGSHRGRHRGCGLDHSVHSGKRQESSEFSPEPKAAMSRAREPLGTRTSSLRFRNILSPGVDATKYFLDKRNFVKGSLNPVQCKYRKFIFWTLDLFWEPVGLATAYLLRGSI